MGKIRKIFEKIFGKKEKKISVNYQKKEEILDKSNKKGQEENVGEEEELEEIVKKPLPILPLINSVLLPYIGMPIRITRIKSQRLIEDVSAQKQRYLVVVAQKHPTSEEAGAEDIYSYGTLCDILKLFRLPDGSLNIIARGKAKVKIEKIIQETPYLVGKVSIVRDEIKNPIEAEALKRTLLSIAEEVFKISEALPPEFLDYITKQENLETLIYMIAHSASFPVEELQNILEIQVIEEKAKKLVEYLKRELEVSKVTREIQEKVKQEMDKTQREFILKQQLKAIQAELGEIDKSVEDIKKLKEKAEKKQLPQEVKEVLAKEIEKLSITPLMSPEYTVIRNYIDWILELPWNEFTPDNLDIERAQRILDEDHYNLEKVKKRILEYLAVMKLKGGSLRGPVLCFVGPPGVGKTSLGKSIARALGRKFVRISLGGIRDEAEIRGHRRTYVGALPGRIIQGMRKAQSSNPVFMLDEIDKIGIDFRGDPSAALLEVLDPEQNHSFSDHYLEVPYDLSHVMFITTANTLDTIPPPLLDRMEVIHIPGYTEEEKLKIAKYFIIPRQMKENGIPTGLVEFQDSAVKKIILNYTKEAGVRNLERNIASVLRGIAKKIAEKLDAETLEKAIQIYQNEPIDNIAKYDITETCINALKNANIYTIGDLIRNKQKLIERQLEGMGEEHINKLLDVIDRYISEAVTKLEVGPTGGEKDFENRVLTIIKEKVIVTPDSLREYLGPEKFITNVAEMISVPGVAVGLAWTPFGGDILFIEAIAMKGTGKLILTGQLGDVMKESANAAFSYVKSKMEELKIPEDAFKYWDVHIHVPEGAVPKDGPSAGITILTVLVSLFTQRKVRSDIAMTGEITLRGLILPVGGIKEKVLAAKRAGIKTVILPEKNKGDWEELSESIKEGINFVFVKHVDEVINLALEDTPVFDPFEKFVVKKTEVKDNEER